MKKIKYYDAINKREINIGVNNNIADFIEENDKYLKKQNNLIIKNERALNKYLTEEQIEEFEKSETYEKLIKRKVRKLLACLTEQQRKIIDMHYYKNYSISKIAKELNISKGTVQKSIERSLKKMRNNA